MSITDLRDELRRFAAERDWDQFHTPRSLLLALTGEVGELCELMQWKTDEQIRQLALESKDDTYRTKISHELADVFTYLIRLSDKVGVDLYEATKDKIVHNALKYPVTLCKGKSDKYDELKSTNNLQ
eukprot:ANDGO_03079.mRNA.1 uncharacterized protein